MSKIVVLMLEDDGQNMLVRHSGNASSGQALAMCEAGVTFYRAEIQEREVQRRVQEALAKEEAEEPS